MLKVLIISIFILFIYGICIFGEKLTDIHDYFKAPAVLMDNNHLCIWDQPQSKIRIYSIKGFKKIAEFGKKGQGPGEFIGISNVSMNKDHIFVSCFPKVCIFAKDGKLIKEIKGPTDAGGFIPFGEKFIGISFPYSKPNEKKGKKLFSLYDSQLRKLKDVFFTEINKILIYDDNKQIVNWYNGCNKAYVYNDRLFIPSTDKGFNFFIFDHRGNKLYEIKKNYVKRNVTEKDKIRKIEEAKNSWGEARWSQFISMYEIRLPKFYPAYANFIIDNEKIYVFMYPKEKIYEISILSLKGKILAQKEIPVLETPGCIESGRVAIKNGRLYYMVENEKTDGWELHEINIDGDAKG
ncbi:MAG: hypothetical protein JSV88_09890 [Candidatus Aminicenantes bacterium]|nr:MAG: hypothetical protein JSV88_09890 [Candidatus Aminicenantes bacterium]